MVVGVAALELYIPGCASLKEKRQVLRSLKDRLRRRFNVAVCEVEHQDLWQRATLAVVTTANDAAVVHAILSQAQRLVEGERRVELVDVQVELR
jgi:hypothetical protein